MESSQNDQKFALFDPTQNKEMYGNPFLRLCINSHPLLAFLTGTDGSAAGHCITNTCNRCKSTHRKFRKQNGPKMATFRTPLRGFVDKKITQRNFGCVSNYFGACQFLISLNVWNFLGRPLFLFKRDLCDWYVCLHSADFFEKEIRRILLPEGD